VRRRIWCSRDLSVAETGADDLTRGPLDCLRNPATLHASDPAVGGCGGGRACFWANAIVSRGADPERAGRALCRQGDRRLRTRRKRKGIVRSIAPAHSRARHHVRVVPRTGYRWGFALQDAHGLLLATHVGGQPLSHDHGAPIRLVVPGARGFQWVKWVQRVELHQDPDYGAPASTVWSSFTRVGRGEA